MTTTEVATMIASLEIPFAYYQFEEGTAEPTPFICYYYGRSNDFVADGTNYSHIWPLVIELYTDQKDFAREKAVADKLTANGFVYTKTTEYIGSERMYMTTFETEVVITDA